MATICPTPAKTKRLIRSKSTYIALAPSMCLVGVILATAVGCHDRQAGKSVARGAAGFDFNQDVQPILASNCFSCHGPDPEMRKAGPEAGPGRVGIQEAAGASRCDCSRASGTERADQADRVKGPAPPDAAIAAGRSQADEGGRYRHPERVDQGGRGLSAALGIRASPSGRSCRTVAQNDGWAKTPIDAFILARLKKEGLHPSPEADKETLIRRVTLDLTGLLPTPAEVRAFEKDTSPQAYEHLVDGLLARPSFGEQRARYWLDYARYADTYGLHYDNSRDIWPYRDYVIRSFNSNKPFDQFAMEQIAGDLMPAKNLDPLIASGYVRLGVSSNEGGTIPEELRVNIARERTEAYGATFMGLTVGCAVCHDHKYDPTTQKDFYALSAFFNNLEEKPFNNDRPVWTPVVRIPKPQNQNEYNRVLAERSELAERLRLMRLQQRALVEQVARVAQESAAASIDATSSCCACGWMKAAAMC